MNALSKILFFILPIIIFSFAVGCTKTAPAKQPTPTPEIKKEPAKEQKFLDMATFEDFIRRFNDESQEVREKAIEEMYNMRIDGCLVPEEVGIRALKESTKPYKSAGGVYEIKDQLVYLLLNQPKPAYIPVIRANYAKMDERSQNLALSILAQIEKREATQAYVDLIKKYGWSEMSFPRMQGTFAAKPRDDDLLFPAFLDGTLAPNRPEVGNNLFLIYAQKGALSQATIDKTAPVFFKQWKALYEELVPLQKTEGITWRYEEKYEEKSIQAELILDTMGYLPTPETQNVLKEALSLKDPVLLVWAALSLVLQNKADIVPTKTWETIAEDGWSRWILFRRLSEINRKDLFPAKWLKQEFLAEAELVKWLMYPTELGRPPDAIELMETFSTRTKNGKVEFFLFRFKTDPPYGVSDSGWMAGLAGPYLVKNYPTGKITGSNATFSQFKAWDTLTPKEHLKGILGNLQEWRKKYNRKN